LRVFESRVLRKIFGPKRDELMEGVEKTHSFIHSFIHSFTLFSIYPYTGRIPRTWKLS
jgi:hypothetical protein